MPYLILITLASQLQLNNYVHLSKGQSSIVLKYKNTRKLGFGVIKLITLPLTGLQVS
jgi:hypothetical protein